MDALAALGVWGYEATFPGVKGASGGLHVFRIDATPATGWLVATLDGGHLSYLPGMLRPDDRELMLEAMEDGLIVAGELVDENRRALESVSGWPWWSAAKLIGTMGQAWETTGALLILSGVNPDHVSLGAFLAAFYALLWRDASKDGRMKLAAAVASMPAEALSPDGVWDEDAATDAVWAVLKAQGHNVG